MTLALTLSPFLTLTLTPTVPLTRRIAQLDRAKLLASLVPVHTEAYPLPQKADLSPTPTPNSALTTTATTTTTPRPAPYAPPEQAGHSALPEHRHFFSGITPDVRERLQARAARGHAQLPKRSRKKSEEWEMEK